MTRWHSSARGGVAGTEPFLAPPHPSLRRKLKSTLASLKRAAGDSVAAERITLGHARTVGLDDGAIYPGDAFPLGTSIAPVRRAALARAPLTGEVRVLVLLVDFPGEAMKRKKKSFEKLFFSIGELKKGSVREYFREVSNHTIDIVGEVVGPLRMPKKQKAYAHGASGMGHTEPNARTMARAAAVAADPLADFDLFDNDGDGFIDAFIVVHAGKGAEVTGSKHDIWSHKWVLPGGALEADGKKIYAYLTVPEDCKVGVCCHELGHLLFGWPDLYDTDGSSEGIGNWCLMAGGCWNGNGKTPAHPSAWCKASQGWISVVNQKSNETVKIVDVKTGFEAYRLWKNGRPGSEYFLVENRQRAKFDSKLPGDGLVIYHVDEAIDDNSNEAHPKVALVQADGKRQLEKAINQGDAGDPYPGSTKNRSFDATSDPDSRSYGGMPTAVSVTSIGASGASIRVKLVVT
jgi:immune inhibitor A